MQAALTNVRSWGENGLNADLPPRPSLTQLCHSTIHFAALQPAFSRDGVVMCGSQPEEGSP